MACDNLSYNTPSAMDRFEKQDAYNDRMWNKEFGPDLEKIAEIRIFVEAIDHKVALTGFDSEDAKTFQYEFGELMKVVFSELRDAETLINNKREAM
jgi:hypothetical protein